MIIYYFILFCIILYLKYNYNNINIYVTNIKIIYFEHYFFRSKICKELHECTVSLSNNTIVAVTTSFTRKLPLTPEYIFLSNDNCTIYIIELYGCIDIIMNNMYINN